MPSKSIATPRLRAPPPDYCTNNNTAAKHHRHHDIDIDNDTDDALLRPYIDSTSDAPHDSPHPPLDLDLHLRLLSAPPQQALNLGGANIALPVALDQTTGLGATTLYHSLSDPRDMRR